MDKEKARILINKINALYKNIDANTPGVSPLERDLLLSYLRQFYETIALGKLHQKTEEKSEADLSTREIEKNRPPTKDIVKPKEDNSIEGNTTIELISKVPAEEFPFQEKDTATYHVDLTSLFIWQEPSNLAEKLANQPLSGLSLSSFSMNEKLLYENDLFGKNKAEMEEAIKMLNHFTHYDQAKTFLLQIGAQYDWHKEERKDAAKSFINTVRRRFL